MAFATVVFLDEPPTPSDQSQLHQLYLESHSYRYETPALEEDQAS
jgi:hypothetical protein